MELDDHISKYIDGELTEEEDVILRKLLAEDDFARDKFDSAVTVHLAMKEDSDSIVPPDDILRQTEDIVLMKILASQPIVVERPVFWRRSQLLAALIVFFILSFVFQIDDMQLDSLGKKLGLQISESNPDNYKPAPTENIINNDLVASPKRIVDRKASTLKGKKINTDLAVSSMSESARGSGVYSDVLLSDESAGPESKEELNEPSPAIKPASPVVDYLTNDKKDELTSSIIPDNIIFYNKIEKQKEIEGGKDNNVMNSIAVNRSKPGMKKNNLVAEPVQMKPAEEKTEIIFSSFLGTDFVRSGFEDGEKTAITNFSQSIAYTINEDDKMGIEIGYSEYSYKEDIVLSSPYQSLKSDKSPIIETSDLEMPIGVDFYDNLISFNKQRQMVWGSAFYEKSLIKSADITLEGRIGLGMSHDGPLSYGRLFGRYEFLNGFSLTIGTEGRLFQANLPGESLSRRLKSSATVIYGFQIKF
jgi:hypothetical protein